MFIGNVHALKVTPTSINLQTNTVSYVNFTFYNNQNTTQNISLNPSITYISYYTDFNSIGAYPQSFTLSPNETMHVLFSFETKAVYDSSPTEFPINYTDNGVSSSFNLYAAIIPITKTSIYLYSANSSKSFYPFNTINFQVSIMNSLGKTRVILPLVYNFTSKSKLIYSNTNDEIINNLGLNTYNLVIPLNSINYSLSPGIYNISVYTNYNQNISALSFPVKILSYYNPVITKTSSFSIFGGSSSITIKNEGNVPINRSNISLPISAFNSLFLISKSSSIGSASVYNGSLFPSIDNLLPGQSITLKYSTSYYPIYLIIFIIILGVFIYLYFNRKVTLKKEVIEHNAIGGFIDIKIALRLKNISRKKIYNMEIEDKIPPNSLKISKAGQKEGKITKKGSNMSISWKEEELNPGDEIIVMYEVKSKIGIVGNFELDKANAKFDLNGKNYYKKSNSLVLHIKS
jgi:hypothetical protein